MTPKLQMVTKIDRERQNNSFEIHYYIYSQVILHMETKAIQLGKKVPINYAGTTGYYM